MITPDVLPLKTETYRPDGEMVHGQYVPTEHDYLMMDLAMEAAEQAGLGGDTPVGAVYVPEDGEPVVTQTREFRDHDLEAHAEKRGYEMIQPKAGRDLSGYTLYSNMEPCHGCAYMLDKGDLGKLFAAARKTDFPEFFRNGDTLAHIWTRSRRELTVVYGLRKARAIEIFTTFPKKH